MTRGERDHSEQPGYEANAVDRSDEGPHPVSDEFDTTSCPKD